MLGKPNKQKDFFDSYVYENLLPAEHILLDIKQKIDFSFVEEETKDLYDNQLFCFAGIFSVGIIPLKQKRKFPLLLRRRIGRPSYPPEVLFKMLFLEFYYNLSDVEVASQVNTMFSTVTSLACRFMTPHPTIHRW